MLWLWLIVSVVSAGLGAYVAKGRGRPVVAGIIFGALIGPFGVVAVRTLPEITPDPVEEGWAELARPAPARHRPPPLP